MGERNSEIIEDYTARETGSVLLWKALPAKGLRNTWEFSDTLPRTLVEVPIEEQSEQ